MELKYKKKKKRKIKYNENNIKTIMKKNDEDLGLKKNE